MQVRTAEQEFTKCWWTDLSKTRILWLELHILMDEIVSTLCAYGLFILVLESDDNLDNNGRHLTVPPNGEVYCCGVSMTKEPLQREFIELRNKLDLMDPVDLKPFLSEQHKVHPPEDNNPIIRLQKLLAEDTGHEIPLAEIGKFVTLPAPISYSVEKEGTLVVLDYLLNEMK